MRITYTEDNSFCHPKVGRDGSFCSTVTSQAGCFSSLVVHTQCYNRFKPLECAVFPMVLPIIKSRLCSGLRFIRRRRNAESGGNNRHRLSPPGLPLGRGEQRSLTFPSYSLSLINDFFVIDIFKEFFFM